MKKLGVVLKWLLLIWGAISLLALGFMVTSFAYNMGALGLTGSRNKKDKATPADVRYVLNWCKIGDTKTEKVIHSYVSERSFTGDHVDAYAIKIKPVELSELQAAQSPFGEGWIRGDKVTPVVRDAVQLATGFMNIDDLRWFPSESDLLSDRYYIWSFTIYLHGSRATATELIFIRPEDDMVFFAGVKT
jgi:hypothetical protein